MDFKQSLNLPDPQFTIPMKADLALREPSIQAHWDEMGIYGQLLEARKDAPTFLLHDGPPYTNSPIHIGTGFNKILKDFVLKSRLVQGYRVPYVPGFDNHGLPIEQAVLKKFAEKKVVPSKIELRKACREHAAEFISLQSKQFQRLGIFGLWDKPYTTMNFRFEAEIVRVFRRLVEKGYVYRGLRPTLWSPTAQTALADTEIVYQDITSKAIFVRFKLKSGQQGLPSDLQGKENVYAVIWTTTPWTIPANLALAFHAEHDYDIVKVESEHYLVIHQLVEKVAEQTGWTGYEVVGQFKGSEMERKVFSHPIFDRDSLGVLADYVTTEDGTGIVHTAPGHGRDDFFTGQKYGLPVLCPVNEKGILTEEAGEFQGVYYKKCDTIVVDRLRELGALLAENDFHHSYPHAERDNQPVIFRATEQWFVSIDHEGLRSRIIDTIDHKVEWHPQSGHTRIRNMISGRPDWCISRQRPWGVGIPIFYGIESRVPVLDPMAIESVAQLIDREGSDAWYEKSPADILPNGYIHPETGETEFTKEVDVFDVWFDSGSTQFAVLEGNVEPEWKENLPADLYLEGSDQHRGWFNVSLILGMALHGNAPFKEVVTHGFLNDEKGDKLSKRAGNSLDPVSVCDQFGADVLRYWAASVDYENDAPCGLGLLQVAGDGYRRIRNTLRFLLGNLYDFDTHTPVVFGGIDKWMVEKTNLLVEDCILFYNAYRFNQVLSSIHNFCVHEVSAFFGDAIKDRMYCDAADSMARRSAQWACYDVLLKLTKLVAPIIPHTAEEVYAKIPGERKASVFLDQLYRIDHNHDHALHKRVDVLLSTRGWVFAEFEKWKDSSEVKDSQDIAAQIFVPEDEQEILLQFGDELPTLFKMAAVDLLVGSPSVHFSKSPWEKCVRSRLRRADVKEVVVDGETVQLSARDRKVLGI